MTSAAAGSRAGCARFPVRRWRRLRDDSARQQAPARGLRRLTLLRGVLGEKRFGGVRRTRSFRSDSAANQIGPRQGKANGAALPSASWSLQVRAIA